MHKIITHLRENMIEPMKEFVRDNFLYLVGSRVDKVHTKAQQVHEKRIAMHDEAYVNWCLRGSYNALGVAQWWDRCRDQLGGNTPRQCWDNRREDVVRLAESLVGDNDIL